MEEFIRQFFSYVLLLVLIFFGGFVLREAYYKNKAKYRFKRKEYGKGFDAGIKTTELGDADKEPMKKIEEKIKSIPREKIPALLQEEKEEVLSYFRYLVLRYPEKMMYEEFYNLLLKSFMEEAKKDKDVKRAKKIMEATASPYHQEIFRKEVENLLKERGDKNCIRQKEETTQKRRF